MFWAGYSGGVTLPFYCPTCKNLCADKAFACPKCGHPFRRPPQPRQKTQVSGCFVVFLLTIAGSFYLCIGGGNCFNEASKKWENASRSAEQRKKYQEGRQRQKYAKRMFNGCRRWGKDDAYMAEKTAAYRVAKDVGMMSEDEILRGSLDACIDRVESNVDVPDCQECMRAIIRELFDE